ncbi:MAG: alkane 1-monooxygenase [Aeromicrobium sp.]
MTIHATVDGQQVQWRDTKRYLWLIGTIIPILPLGTWGLYAWTGSALSWWFGPVFVFVIVPLADLIAGLDPNNPPDELIEALEEDRYYRRITYAFIPLQISGLIWASYLFGGGTLPGLDGSLALVDKLGLAVSVGMVAGICINTAHELGHKKKEHERWFARVALSQTFYGHFYIEHNRGHHARVATPEDPASARLGETLWEFLPRTMSGSLRSAWRPEKKRFDRQGRSHWSIKNDLFNAWAFSVVLWGGLMIAFGWQILPFLIIQALAGIWLLESVNYLEHYGMKRRVLESGRPERVNPSHSWNSNNIGTNVLLYHLQRHSDHHANPTRRYQALRDSKDAPVLPTGYAGMIVLACVPHLWRRVMDHRVMDHLDGDLTSANLHPRVAATYERRYGKVAA